MWQTTGTVGVFRSLLPWSYANVSNLDGLEGGSFAHGAVEPEKSNLPPAAKMFVRM